MRRAVTDIAAVTKAGAELSTNAGRWVKLTEESAQALKLNQFMAGSSPGVARDIITTDTGKITKIAEFVRPGKLGSLLRNPASLTSIAALLSQLAMQHQMDEISRGLATIDAKVDEVHRWQKSELHSCLDGATRSVAHALEQREEEGMITELEWTKIQTVPQTINEIAAFALAELQSIPETIEYGRSSNLPEAMSESKQKVLEWLSVLAQCVKLEDAMAILELDRVFRSAPEDLERQRTRLLRHRDERRTSVESALHAFSTRIDAIAVSANHRVLRTPRKSVTLVRARNVIASSVAESVKAIGASAAGAGHRLTHTVAEQSQRVRDRLRGGRSHDEKDAIEE